MRTPSDARALRLLEAQARDLGIADADAEGSQAALPPGLTEDALAAEFTARHGAELRYVPTWGRWLRWAGHVWRADDVLAVYNLARAVCREAAAGEEPRIRARIASAQTVAAVVRLAQSDPAHARAADAWDRDPDILNTPGGMVHLPSGHVQDCAPEEHCTKSAAVAPNFEADCPLWLAVLERATQGDRELVAYLQRLSGYALTGHTVEHSLSFWYGTGANSKGVILNTLTGILGDYAVIAPAETFTEARGERHPTEIAMLRGARLVVAQETEANRPWAEARLKQLTGGDPVTARVMRGDFFTFRPAFKLVIAGNHKPSLRNVDEAIRRRLQLVPFKVTIPAAERDPRLTERLRAEWPAILAWAVRGCLAWQAEGLRPPAAVTETSEDYFAAEDSIAGWLADSCIERPDLVASNSDLWRSWLRWAETAHEASGTQKAFNGRLQAHGFEPKKDVAGLRGRGFRGLAVRSEEAE